MTRGKPKKRALSKGNEKTQNKRNQGVRCQPLGKWFSIQIGERNKRGWSPSTVVDKGGHQREGEQKNRFLATSRQRFRVGEGRGKKRGRVKG